MTDLELERIREALRRRLTPVNQAFLHISAAEYAADVGALLEEIDRLRAEDADLRAAATPAAPSVVSS